MVIGEICPLGTKGISKQGIMILFLFFRSCTCKNRHFVFCFSFLFFHAFVLYLFTSMQTHFSLYLSDNIRLHSLYSCLILLSFHTRTHTRTHTHYSSLIFLILLQSISVNVCWSVFSAAKEKPFFTTLSLHRKFSLKRILLEGGFFKMSVWLRGRRW